MQVRKLNQELKYYFGATLAFELREGAYFFLHLPLLFTPLNYKLDYNRFIEYINVSEIQQ